MVQYLESAELNRFGTLTVTAELEGFILSLLSIQENYESPDVVYPPEGHMNLHDIVLH